MSEESSNWFADLIGDGSSLVMQMQQVKDFAYASFDRLDQDKNGFLSQQELELALTHPDMSDREKAFLRFLLENHAQITDAHDEQDLSGISRKDLESYFDLIATLL